MKKSYLIGSLSLITILVGIVYFFPFSGSAAGPVIINRDLVNPSIHEGTVTAKAGVKDNVNPTLGQVPASYDWSNFFAAIGSAIQPFTANPSWMGQKSGSTNYYKGIQEFTSRYFAGVKGIGGKDVTDVASLGQICGDKPGDAYWVGIPREGSLGNVENPPPYQWAKHQYDCFCRCNEKIECPIGPLTLRHYNHGGTNNQLVDCQVCFAGMITKHDKYVGTDHGSFPGYPVALPNDPGYLECLTQSPTSYAATGGPANPGSQDGGGPIDLGIFGI